jgi:co-chaperonin GroES (HSP10)
MLRNLIGVEKLGKQSKKNAGDLFAPVEVTHNIGVVRYVGEELSSKFTVGQKVYCGNQREEIRMDGADIMVMQEANIFAIVEDSNEEAKEEPEA